MRPLRQLRRLFHWDRFGRDLDRSLQEELEFHLQTRIEQLEAAGLSPEEARAEAVRRFGNRDEVARRCRRIDEVGTRRRLRHELFADLLQDARLAFRSLRSSPGFTVVAALSLAVGIGVNTALLTAIHAVWVAPVPGVTAQERIVDMVPVVRGHEQWNWTYPDFERVRDSSTPFESLAAWAERDAALGTEEGGRRARVAYATSGYFDVLGVRPAFGRALQAREDAGPGEHPVAVVSHRFWRDRLGGDTDVLGHALVVDGIPYTVVGVMPEEFRGARINLGSVDLWVPLFQHPAAADADSIFRDPERGSVQVLARLREGATRAEAQAAVAAVFANLAAESPDVDGTRTVRVARFGRFPAQNRLGDLVAVIGVFGLLAVLLLIICGNLAGMSMARSAAREQEIAVRLALGSSRVRLVRHLMVEALIVALLGGGLGIVAAIVGMTRVSPMDLNIAATDVTFEPSAWTVLWSLALCLVAAQAFGLLPALRFSRPELVSALKDDSGGGGRRVGRFQRCAAASQIGAAFLLLLVGTLFLRSLDQMDGGRLGFNPDGLAVTDFRTAGPFLGLLDLAEADAPGGERGSDARVDEMIEAIGSVPGIASVAVASGLPLDRRRAGWSLVAADRGDREQAGVRAEYTFATEGYFTTLEVPVLQGRGLLRTDDHAAPPVAVVTRSLAEKLWPGGSALGRRFTRAGGEDPVAWTVVGVVADVASSVATEELPHAFLSLRQASDLELIVLIRADGDPSPLAGEVVEALRSVVPGVPAPILMPGSHIVSRATQDQRTSGQLAAGIGLLVLLLSAMGVHGVVALAVAHRTREIGLRIAMGATRSVVVRSVLHDALATAAPGLLVGGFAAVVTAAVMRSMLLGLSPVDPLSLLLAGGLLVFVVLNASLGPALRASGIHPMEALRKG